MSLADHFDRVRRILAGHEPSPYTQLVRAQQHQVLRQMFERARCEAGERVFDEWVETFRAAAPPTDPHPTRWARSFADWLENQQVADERTLDLVIYAALRLEVEIAPDVPGSCPADTAHVAAFSTDPRAAAAVSALVALVVFRAATGEVRTGSLDLDTAVALSAHRGQMPQPAPDPATLERGRANLRRWGLLPSDIPSGGGASSG